MPHRLSTLFGVVALCILLFPITNAHHRRRKLSHLLGLTLELTTTTTPEPSHFSFVVAPTKYPQQNLLIALDSVSTAATLGKEYDGNHDQYTTPATTSSSSPTPAPNYVGGLGSFSPDTFNKYYANNGLYSNNLGNGAGYWGGGGGSYNPGGGGGSYNPGGGYNNYGPMESKYSYDPYDRDYSMSYDSGYDYGAGSMVGSIGSYLSYLIMDPGSIIMAAAALSLKALVLNLVLVATNRTRRRRRSLDSPFDDDYSSTEVLDAIVETLQVTLEAPAKCRARMFCESGRRIRNGLVSRSGNMASIVRYFGTKMEDQAYLSLSSSPSIKKYWPSLPRRECKDDFPKCPEQIPKLNAIFASLSPNLPYIELIPAEEKQPQQTVSLSQEPT